MHTIFGGIPVIALKFVRIPVIAHKIVKDSSYCTQILLGIPVINPAGVTDKIC